MNINIPTPLRTYTGGAETVAVPGATVAEVFDQLTSQFPSSTSTSTTKTSATSPPKKPPPSPPTTS